MNDDIITSRRDYLIKEKPDLKLVKSVERV
nr:MAG TPA: hypothetical protein [Caudoviricetes sp.]